MITKDTVEQMLLQMHTAFVGKLISVSGNTAKVQPLSMIKQRDGKLIKPAVLPSVPICGNVKKIGQKTITIEGQSFTVPELSGLSGNEIVLCVCSERDSSETRRGKMSEPAFGHHSLSDAFIVGIIGD